MKICHVNISKLIVLLAISSAATFSLSCKTVTGPVSSSCDCNPPVRTSFGVLLPSVAHLYQRVSPDGRTMAYIGGKGDISLLDLQTMKTTYLNLLDILPNTPRSSYCGDLLWAPYSSSRLLIHTADFFDSSGYTLSVQNCYIYDFSTGKAVRVTPKRFGNYGSSNYFDFYGWLKGSTSSIDSLLTDSAIYVPQEDKYYPLPASYSEVIYQSPKTDDYFRTQRDYSKGVTQQMFINTYPFAEGVNIAQWDDGPHWSPSGKKIALSVISNFPSINPNDPYNYEEVWIIDVPTFNEYPNSGLSLYRLDFQELFCTYSFNGIYAEFLTDSTLAVSMCKDGATVCPIWEITTKGKLVKQLTF